MNLIESSVKQEIQEPGLEGIYKSIDLAARVCYASTPTMESKQFVDSLIKRGHLSPLEFGTVYLTVPTSIDISFYSTNKYTRVTGDENNYYITTNYRVIIENKRLLDLKFLTEPTKHHVRRTTFKFILSEGIAREFNRHRTHSIVQQSTRYCNFTKDKFNKEITFIIPYWAKIEPGHYTYNNILGKFISSKQEIDSNQVEFWLLNCFFKDEMNYFELIKNFKLKPQEARELLPLGTKTVLMHCAFNDDWYDFVHLRASTAAHPDAAILADRVNDRLNTNVSYDISTN